MKRPRPIFSDENVPVYAVGAAGFWLDHFRLAERDPLGALLNAKFAEMRAHLQRIGDTIFPST